MEQIRTDVQSAVQMAALGAGMAQWDAAVAGLRFFSDPVTLAVWS